MSRFAEVNAPGQLLITSADSKILPPLKRSCEPAELGAMGVFLASDGAASLTGQVIYVDGGYQIMGM